MVVSWQGQMQLKIPGTVQDKGLSVYKVGTDSSSNGQPNVTNSW